MIDNYVEVCVDGLVCYDDDDNEVSCDGEYSRYDCDEYESI